MKKFIILALFCCAAVVCAEKIDWEKAEKIQQGVRWVKLALEEPRLMKVNIFRVDLKTPGLEFAVTGRDPDWGKEMPDYPGGKLLIRTKRIKTVDFMLNARKAGRNMIVAVNASPWGPWTRPYNHTYADTYGYHISDGVIVSQRSNYPVFCVDKNNVPHIKKYLKKEEVKDIRQSVAGFRIILRDGKDLSSDRGLKSLHPRTAYGLSKDKRYLYLVTVDGRQKLWSDGANMRDLSRLMLRAGASDALNMDGGGSTSLVYFDAEKGEPCFVNRHFFGRQRNVGSSMGIIINSGKKVK